MSAQPPQPPAVPPGQIGHETVTYNDVRVVVMPVAQEHYKVDISDGKTTTHHAVERVLINNTVVRFDEPLWFIDVSIDVGLPLFDHGDTAWVWL